MIASPQIVLDVEGEVSGTPGVSRAFAYAKIDGDNPLISLSIYDTTGVTSYYWEIIAKPAGSLSVLNDPVSSTPTFLATDSVSGTYLIRVTINGSSSSSIIGLAFFEDFAAYDLRKIAKGETLEFGSDGWSEAINTMISAIVDVSSEGVSFTNAEPMPETVGGWEAGSTFSGATAAELWQGLLYPYQYPAFSAFAISGQSTVLEVGDEIGIDKTFTWTTTNSSNVEEGTISITDVTGGVTIVSGLADLGTFDSGYPFVPIVNDVPASNVFRIAADDTRANEFTRDFTVYWRSRVYYGELASSGPILEADIIGLRANGLVSGFAGTYVFAADAGKYKYLCYPAVLGTATSFKDSSTNLDVPFEAHYLVSVTNGFLVTIPYRVHRTTNAIGGAINIIVS